MRSHASSIARLIGWCALRSALKPASLSISTRRSSARAMVAAPSTPLSWWMHAPRSFDRFAVDAQPARGVDRRGCGCRTSVVARSSSPPSPSTDGAARVERRVRRRSTGEAGRRRGAGAASRPPREHGERRDVARDDRAGVVDDLGRHAWSSVVTRGVVLDDGGDRDHRAVVVDVGRGHVHAVERDVHRLADDEVHVAVDARARVPAGVVVRGRLDRDRRSPRRSAGARRSTRRSSSSRTGGDRRACRSRTPTALRYTPSNSTRIRLPRSVLGRRRTSSRTPTRHRGSSRCPSARRGSRRPPIIASCGSRTGTHGCGAAADQLHEDVHLRADAPVVVERGADHDAVS